MLLALSQLSWAQSNGILREVYLGIAGSAVSDLTNSVTFPNQPSSREIRSSFESPTNIADNYGQRFTAWITPPATGNYVFWIAGDDGSALYLGTNHLESSKRLVAHVPGWTSPRQWTKYAQQQSAAISLVAGERYFIEALMKEQSGGDNLCVRWQLPDAVIEEPITNTRLQVVRQANADSITMRHGTKARINVTLNDLGYYTNPVQLVTAPTSGTAIANSDGTILYTHMTGTPASDSFTYRLSGPGGPPSSNATVTINFTSAARFDSDFVRLPTTPPATQWGVADAFPSLTFNSPNNMCSAPGDTQKLFVVESAGRVWMIPDVTASTPTKVLFLNITDRVTSDAFERGAKGVSCHPGFVTNGFIYVTYDYTSNSVVRTRLSRFTRSTLNPQQADSSSEVVLINQVLDGPYHDVNSCRFGPDGYLYVAFGDEGGQNEDYQNAQRIDKDLYSSIIRIDVDKKPGNLEPNPDTDIPRDGGGLAYFSVPSNNPFVGATNFNKQPVNPSQVRTEIYVMGLRNPWQFSFAPGTNKLWVGDVQRDAREELDLLGPGDNGGWSWREATVAGPRTGQIINGAAETNATLTGPALEYGHGSATNQGNSITGGFVYQGTNYPGLDGLYIFGDFVSGNIWTINPTNPPATFTRITGGQNPVAFLADPAKNDILFIEWGSSSGRIRRLVYGTDDSSFPQTLSETGFFADLTSLTPNPGGYFYEPNLRFWSDYADKSRWFLSKSATNKMTYSRDGTWTFPAGMIWAKHFDLQLNRTNPASSKRIETRFLVKTASGAYGVTYKWNDTGTEAFLVPEAGEEFNLTVTNASVTSTQRYHIPSRAECLNCHTPESGSVLSFSTRQLNRTNTTLAGLSGNFLTLLDNAGYLAGLNESPNLLPRHVRPDESQYSLEARVRSYLSVNCAYCHHAGVGPPSWDGSPQLNLWDTHLVNGMPVAAGNDPSHRLVFPGDPSKSIVWNRMAATNSYTRMPPIATTERDLAAMQLVYDWISTNLPTRMDYNAWRLAYFGNLVSPQGERTANPDGDRDNNEAEYLKYSNPTNGFNFYTPSMTTRSNHLTLQLPNFAGRRITVKSSIDLGVLDPWTPRDISGNNGIPLATGQTNSLVVPATETKRFFQLFIQEE